MCPSPPIRLQLQESTMDSPACPCVWSPNSLLPGLRLHQVHQDLLSGRPHLALDMRPSPGLSLGRTLPVPLHTCPCLFP